MSKKKKEKKLTIEPHYVRFRKEVLKEYDSGPMDDIIKKSFYSGVMAGIIILAEGLKKDFLITEIWHHLEKELDQEFYD